MMCGLNSWGILWLSLLFTILLWFEPNGSRQSSSFNWLAAGAFSNLRRRSPFKCWGPQMQFYRSISLAFTALDGGATDRQSQSRQCEIQPLFLLAICTSASELIRKCRQFRKFHRALHYPLFLSGYFITLSIREPLKRAFGRSMTCPGQFANLCHGF